MKLQYRIRTLYLELCLRLRVLRQAMLGNIITPVGRLYAVVTHPDGREENLGLVSTKVVSTAFVNYAVDQLQAETSTFGDFKFHDSGTGVVAENATDVDLGTRVETARVTGTQTEGASANIYRSVGIMPYTATRAITEHGLFNVATVSTPTLMDRSVFAAINVINGMTITFTYELTMTAGS